MLFLGSSLLSFSILGNIYFDVLKILADKSYIICFDNDNFNYSFYPKFLFLCVFLAFVLFIPVINICTFASLSLCVKFNKNRLFNYRKNNGIIVHMNENSFYKYFSNPSKKMAFLINKNSKVNNNKDKEVKDDISIDREVDIKSDNSGIRNFSKSNCCEVKRKIRKRF